MEAPSRRLYLVLSLSKDGAICTNAVVRQAHHWGGANRLRGNPDRNTLRYDLPRVAFHGVMPAGVVALPSITLPSTRPL